MRALVDDLRAEWAALDELLGDATEQDWTTPTPAAGWDVRDSVSHLAANDELAALCITGRGEAPLAALIALESPEAATRAQADRGRDLSGVELLHWWRTVREELAEVLLGADPRARVPWGAGPMSARSLATARLMEEWAHGLDCFAALGAVPVDTARLRHVCHLGYRALPYAFRFADEPQPAPLEELQLVLEGPDGEVWRFGCEDAPQRIRGQAGEWARLAVQRLPLSATSTLRAEGPLAAGALRVARAFV